MKRNREKSRRQDSKTSAYHQIWNERYRELEAFKTKRGHCNVPQRQGPLGKWVKNQRTERKGDKLSAERIQRLDDIGFVWELRSSPLTWDERLDELTKYKAEHGDCSVPKSYGPLGHWVTSQRTARRKDKLSEERIQKLDNLGLEWSSNGNTRYWDERLDELRKYKAEHGHCNVPQGQGPLGTWVHNQRQREGTLSEENIQKLDDVGFVWNTQGGQKTWDERLNDLMRYKAEHGDCNVPQGHGTLGIWVHNQRLRKDNLSEERVQKLDDLDFNWDARRRCGRRDAPKEG